MALGGNLKKQRLIPEKEAKSISKKAKSTKKRAPAKKKVVEKKQPVKKVVSKTLIKETKADVDQSKNPVQDARYVEKDALSNRLKMRKRFEAEIADIGDKTIQLIAFDVGNEMFALDINKVKEVVATPTAAKVPGMPSYFKGLVNIRGKTVMALDLNEKLGLSPLDSTPYIMVIKTSSLSLGLLLKELPSALKVKGSQISSSLKTLSRSAHEVFIKGLIKLEGQLVFYLDVEELVNSDKALEFPDVIVKK